MQFGKHEEEQVKVVLKPAVTLAAQVICSRASKPGAPERGRASMPASDDGHHSVFST